MVDRDKALKSDLLKLELLFEYRQQNELEAVAVMSEAESLSNAKLCQNNLDFYLASQKILSAQCAKLSEELRKSIFNSN